MDFEQEQFEDTSDDYLNAGQLLISWEVDEYARHSRSKWWYAISGLIGVALIIYSVATANFLFAIIVLMVGVITLISQFKEPERIPVFITNTGVVIGDTFYDYKILKDFSIVYDPPVVKVLYIDFVSILHPIISIPLEDINPLEVRETLLPYCIENLNRTEENLTDLARRLYKL